MTTTAALLGLPAGLVENVTDGTNAFLVAIDADGRVLGSEEEIVDAKRQNRVKEIFLLRERAVCRGPRGAAARRGRRTLAPADGARGARRLNPRLAGGSPRPI